MTEKKTDTKKMILAVQRTVRAYERLIETGDASGWSKYGCFSACRICKAINEDCFRCPISRKMYACLGVTGMQLRTAIEYKIGIKAAARARLTYLKRRFTRAGIDWRAERVKPSQPK